MGNIRILTPELSDNATLEAHVQAASMEVGNLQRIQPTDVWLSPGTDKVQIDIDLGADWDPAADAYELLWLGFTIARPSDAAVWAVSTGPTQGDISTYSNLTVDPMPVDTEEDWDRPHLLFRFPHPASQNDRWVRFRTSGPTSPFTDFEAGRLYLGTGYVPTKNYTTGAQPPQWREAVRRQVTEAGVVIPQPGVRRRHATFTCNGLTEAEAMTEVARIARLRGVSRDVLVIPNIDGSYLQGQMIYGLMSEPIATRIPKSLSWSVSFSVEEMV